MYKGVGGEEGWAAGGALYLLSGLLRVTIYKSNKCQLLAQTCLEGLRDVSLILGFQTHPHLSGIGFVKAR